MINKILIAEDELVVAFDLQSILERAGFQVCGLASSYIEALEIIDSQCPELVLIDIHLKGKLTGVHLARKLKTLHIPFLFISANNNKKVIDAAIATDPYGFLVKPFREKDLLMAIDVARFRHRDFLQLEEEKIRHLHNLINSILFEHKPGSVKVEKIAAALQTFIPFDMLLIFRRNLHSGNDCKGAVEKKGYDNYQFHPLQKISAIKDSAKLELEDLAEKLFNSDTDCSSGPHIEQPSELEHLLNNFFAHQSRMSFKVANAEQDLILLFLSENINSYDQQHSALLTQLNPIFEKLLGHSFQDEPGEQLPIYETHSSEIADQIAHIPEFEGIIGESPKMISLFDQIKQIAPFENTVLISGDTGTGKEQVAHLIHKLSSRSKASFTIIDCAAMADPLIDFELFGYQREGWDGSIEYQMGKFENADGGTVFLDEISAMPLPLQLRILHIIQRKEITRVGSNEPISVNLRFVVATNRQMETEIALGRFRLDLYFRLNAFPVNIPRLHERKNDVLHLANYFGEMLSKNMNKSFTGISEKMKSQLIHYHWPGNVRELRNILEHSIILNNGESLLELERKLGQF